MATTKRRTSFTWACTPSSIMIQEIGWPGVRRRRSAPPARGRNGPGFRVLLRASELAQAARQHGHRPRPVFDGGWLRAPGAPSRSCSGVCRRGIDRDRPQQQPRQCAPSCAPSSEAAWLPLFQTVDERHRGHRSSDGQGPRERMYSWASSSPRCGVRGAYSLVLLATDGPNTKMIGVRDPNGFPSAGRRPGSRRVRAVVRDLLVRSRSRRICSARSNPARSSCGRKKAA